MVPHPAFTFALALAAGVLAQSLAFRLRVPGIVVLLIAGLLLGPDVAGLVRPAELGAGLQMVVGMSVAVILFEGGMNLAFDRLRTEALTIRRLITFGGFITALGATLAARWIMGWEWVMALLFGTLVIVTGPTVINPLLRRVRVSPPLKTILQAEGVLIDPIGAIVAVVAFEVVIDSSTASSAAMSLLGLPGRLVFGAVSGLVGGAVIGIALKRAVVADELLNVFALSMVILLYQTCELLLPESGIMAAPIAGVIVGNMQHRMKRELSEFKEQLTVLLVGMLFVLLAANVRVAEVFALGFRGIATVLVLMLVVRPLGVFLCTIGSQLALREKLFIAWLGPRGIVAAAMASLFADRLAAEGAPDSTALRALVFLVIAVTVVVQGGLSPVVARLLRVRRPENNGWVIVGANPLARLLGRVLARGGEEVVLLDTNPDAIRVARSDGLRTVLGNASEERTLLQADIESRRGLIALTPNESINLFLTRRANDLFHVSDSIIAISQNGNVSQELVEERGTGVLFGRPIAMLQWYHQLQHGQPHVERWRYEGEVRGVTAESLLHDQREDGALLPLALERGKAILPVTNETRFNPGDVLYLARPAQSADDIERHLEGQGWRFESGIAGAAAERRAQGSAARV